MQKLERRVEALEQAGGGSKARVATVVEFVRPGHLDAPIQELRTLARIFHACSQRRAQRGIAARI